MTSSTFPRILDFEGRPFLPNGLCARRSWMLTDISSSAIPDRSLLWRVVMSPDEKQLFLEARPDGFRFRLDPENGQHRGFFVYRYAPEIDPEGFSDEWATARLTGWEVLAEESMVEPDLLVLSAYNRSKQIQARVVNTRSDGQIDDIGRLMWRELMKQIVAAEPDNRPLPGMRLSTDPQ